jgi:hypothetical protein
MTSPIASRPLSFGRGSVATKNRLTLSDKLTFDDWRAIGTQLAALVDASAWWLGDWVFYGQWQYGKKYIQAVELTGLDEGTLRNYASVAGRFDLSRRRDNLSFSHHAAVVSLPLDEADKYLAEADAKDWSTRELRDATRAAKASAPMPAPLGPADAPIPPESIIEAAGHDLPDHVTFHVETTRLRRWSAAAAAAGWTVSDWALYVLDQAAAAAAIA